jgi:hypothetical protein
MLGVFYVTAFPNQQLFIGDLETTVRQSFAVANASLTELTFCAIVPANGLNRTVLLGSVGGLQ